VIEDHQLVTVDDEDRRPRASEHDLQLLQHHAKQGLELEVGGDGVRDLEQRRQLACPLRHLLLQQAQRALALGHVAHDGQHVHAPGVAESPAAQLEPGQPPVRADAHDARGDGVGGRGPGQVGIERLQIVEVQKVARVKATQLLRAVPGDRAEGGIHRHDAVGEVGDQHAVPRRIDDAAVLGLALGERAFHQPALLHQGREQQHRRGQ
jgi:hypothetical protein